MYPVGIEPLHGAEYLDTNLELGRSVRANREKACLSSMFTWLIRTGQGGVKSNPCKGVKRNKETKRDRYVEDDEMHATLATVSVQVSSMAELVYRTLQRPEDTIAWTGRNLTDRRDADGRLVRIIRTRQGKTGAAVDIDTTPEIDAVLARLKAPMLSGEENGDRVPRATRNAGARSRSLGAMHCAVCRTAHRRQ